MKKQFQVAIFVAAALISAQASAYETPTQVEAGFHTGYIPDGFDTNDHVQVVGEGMFANSCYRPAGIELDVNHASKTINVKPKAYLYNGMCLQMLVPYHQVLDVGILNVGEYEVRQQTDGASLGTLNVRAATNAGPDDFLYAPVSQVYYKKQGNSRQITVVGEFSNSCMKLVDVMVRVQPKVVVVQPLSEATEGTDCREGKFPFEETVGLPSAMKDGRYLLHVRSLNAKAINNLIDVQ